VALDVLRRPPPLRRLLSTAGRVPGAVAAALRTDAPLPVTGRVGTRRDVVWASLPLDPLVRTAHAHGATVNDVVLAVVADALHHHLGPHLPPPGRPARVLVPVGGDTTGGNSFSFVVVEVPLDLHDPLDLLDRVRGTTADRTTAGRAGAVRPLFSVVDLVPVPVLRRVAPEVLARQPFVDLAVTDLPGSPVPLYLRGAQLLDLAPVVTGVGNIACIVGVLSYCGQLGVGLTVDPEVVVDPGRLLAAVERSAQRLASTDAAPGGN